MNDGINNYTKFGMIFLKISLNHLCISLCSLVMFYILHPPALLYNYNLKLSFKNDMKQEYRTQNRKFPKSRIFSEREEMKENNEFQIWQELLPWFKNWWGYEVSPTSVNLIQIYLVFCQHWKKAVTDGEILPRLQTISVKSVLLGGHLTLDTDLNIWF